MITPIKHAPKRAYLRPLDALGVADSHLVAFKDAPQSGIYGAVYAFGVVRAKRFQIRKEAQGYRVWRIE